MLKKCIILFSISLAFRNRLKIWKKRVVNARVVGLEPTTNGSLHGDIQNAI
jgi:hypothetical protein